MEEIVEDYKVINDELGSYHLRLLERPQIVVANKMDLENSEENLKRFKEAYPTVPVYEATTIIHEGLDPILRKAADLLQTTPAFPIENEENKNTGVVYKFEERKKDVEIKNIAPHVWEVSGPKIDKSFDIKKLNTEEDYYLFANRMRYMGIDRMLREAGVEDGDTVQLNGFEFEFVEN